MKNDPFHTIFIAQAENFVFARNICSISNRLNEYRAITCNSIWFSVNFGTIAYSHTLFLFLMFVANENWKCLAWDCKNDTQWQS